jgi:hypothetical protein
MNATTTDTVRLAYTSSREADHARNVEAMAMAAIRAHAETRERAAAEDMGMVWVKYSPSNEPHCFVCRRRADHFAQHDELVGAGLAQYATDGSVYALGTDEAINAFMRTYYEGPEWATELARMGVTS